MATTINQIYKKSALLTPDEELELYKKSCTNDKDRSKFILAFAPLVGGIAKSFLGYGFDFEELTSIGFIGLLRGLNKFDPDKADSASFGTYTQYWVRAEIIEFVLKNRTTVRTVSSAEHKKCFFGLSKFKRKYNINSLSPEHIALAAKEIGLTENQIIDGEARFGRNIIVSTDVPLSVDESITVGSLMIDQTDSVEITLADQQEFDQKMMWINEALDNLGERDRDIVRSRHLNEDGPVQFEVLGNKWGVSKQRIQQLELKALDKIRNYCL